jgi:uncharacterized protein involved in exopolysaccharide biosynthesis
MKWTAIALLLLCAPPLVAQSLGDVARAQREDTSRPHATRVITNGDLSSQESTRPVSASPNSVATHSENPAASNASAKSGTKPTTAQASDPERAIHQRRYTETTKRVQQLQAELSDLERHRSDLRNSMIFGDPNRAQKNTQLKELDQQIEFKNRELTSARAELADVAEDASHTSVLK